MFEADILDWLADRIVNVHGDECHPDIVEKMRELARIIRNRPLYRHD